MHIISGKVKKIISGILDIREDEISEDSKFIKDLGADLFDILTIIIAIEEDFCIDIDDEEINKMETVGQAIAYIVHKLKNKLFRKVGVDTHYTDRLMKLMLLN